MSPAPAGLFFSGAVWRDVKAGSQARQALEVKAVHRNAEPVVDDDITASFKFAARFATDTAQMNVVPVRYYRLRLEYQRPNT